MSISARLGIHSLVWTGRWGIEEARSAIERTRRAGFGILEIGCLDTWEIDVDQTRRLLEEYGLNVVGSLGLGSLTDITSDDPECVSAGEGLLREAVGTVRDLGGRVLTGITYAKLGKYSHPPTDSGWQRSVDVMQRVADHAARADIRLGLEVVNRYDSNLLGTAKQAMEYIEAVDRPNVFIHLDTYHMNMEETDMMTPVLRCRDRLGYVHVSESHRGYLGSGTVDFGAFFRALAAIDYQGDLTFESFSSRVVDPNLSNLLGIWRNVWEDADDLALHARTFIESGLQTATRCETGLVPDDRARSQVSPVLKPGVLAGR